MIYQRVIYSKQAILQSAKECFRWYLSIQKFVLLTLYRIKYKYAVTDQNILVSSHTTSLQLNVKLRTIWDQFDIFINEKLHVNLAILITQIKRPIEEMQKENENPQFNINSALSWQNLMQSHGIHPQYGLLIPPSYTIESFNYKQLQPYFDGIEKKTLTLADVQRFVEQLPEIQIFQGKTKKEFDQYRDMMALHDLLAHIVQIQWRRYRQANPSYKQTNSAVVPMRVKSKIVIPLQKASEFVKIKVGMTVGLTILWKSLNDNYLKDPQNFSFDDFKLTRYFSVTPEEQQMERLFFGGSVIGTYYLALINHQIFNINAIINRSDNEEQIIKKLKRIAKLFQKINTQNKRLLNKNAFSSDAFFYRLRPFLQGYDDIQFQTENGIIKVTQDGASGGNDPLFQVFEKGLEITYDQEYQNMQLTLTKGMSERNKQLINYMKDRSKIRQYCKKNAVISKAYNNILQQYVYFLSMHKVFITRNIIDKIPSHLKMVRKGTGGVKMSTLAERYKLIQELFLPINQE